MRKFLNLCLAIVVFAGVFLLAVQAFPPTAYGEPRYVYIGGNPIGITVNADGLMVTGTVPVETPRGTAYPLEGSGIGKGDVIKALDGIPVGNLYDFRRRIAASEGAVMFTVQRDGKTFDTAVYPVEDRASGQKKAGLILKEDVGGIGTLTFVTEDGNYGALGHHVFDVETGLCDELQGGKIFDVEIEGVIKGEAGKAGGLQASINRLSVPVGINASNTDIGIYGKYTSERRGEKIRVAGKGEARPGKAKILTTTEGTQPEFYDIEIVKSVPQSQSEEKGLVLLVTDKRLLEKAGGIVQGMSGSPIIQNGVLVGAVTHVFVSDPTRGYGVHARFMLENADGVYLAPQPRAYGNEPSLSYDNHRERQKEAA